MAHCRRPKCLEAAHRVRWGERANLERQNLDQRDETGLRQEQVKRKMAARDPPLVFDDEQNSVALAQLHVKISPHAAAPFR
jgi:hypothetical protein